MFGEGIRILEDLSAITTRSDIEDITIVVLIASILVFVCAIVLIRFLFRWSIDAATDLELTHVKTNADKYQSDKQKMDYLVSEIDRLILINGKHLGSINNILSVITGLLISTSAVVIIVCSIGLISKSVTPTIQHKYVIEIIGNDVPIDLLKTYEILEWRDDTTCVIQEKEETK